MFINDISLIWVTLIFLLVGTFSEVFNVQKEPKTLPYCLGSIFLLSFSLNYMQECTDHFHYELNYVKYKNSYDLLNFIQPDNLFGNLASLWQFIFDVNAKNVDPFLVFYQTLSLFILVICIYLVCDRWSNTVLFMSLFGSLHFHHLILCSLRHGLSSSITIIIFTLMYKSQKEGTKIPKKLLFLRNVLLIIIAINAHWTALIIIPLLYISSVIEIILKSDKARIIILLLTCLIITLFSLLMIITLQSQIGFYSENSIEFGARIHFTAIIDVILLFVTQRVIEDEKLTTSELFLIKQLKSISILLIIVKLFTFTGLGAAVRIVMGIHIFQIMCIPSLLDKLNISGKVAILLVLSAPYLFFIFFSKVETFKFANFNF